MTRIAALVERTPNPGVLTKQKFRSLGFDASTPWTKEQCSLMRDILYFLASADENQIESSELRERIVFLAASQVGLRKLAPYVEYGIVKGSYEKNHDRYGKSPNVWLAAFQNPKVGAGVKKGIIAHIGKSDSEELALASNEGSVDAFDPDYQRAIINRFVNTYFDPKSYKPENDRMPLIIAGLLSD